MGNVLFDKGRQGFLEGLIDWDTAVIKASLVRTYTSTSITTAHSVVSDVTAIGTIVATSPALTTKTVTSGVADGDDSTWTAVGAGAAIPTIIIYQSSAGTGGADVRTPPHRLLRFPLTATGPAGPPKLGARTASVR